MADSDDALDRVSQRGVKDGDPLRLDLRGLKCPLPAIRTERALEALPAGATLEVLADDPLASLDIAHLCRTAGHDLIDTVPHSGGGLRFRIRRG